MRNSTEHRFNLDREIAARLGEGADEGAFLEAVAILLDSDLTDSERATGIAMLLSASLDGLSPHEFLQFQRIATSEGEFAAMSYLGELGRRTERNNDPM